MLIAEAAITPVIADVHLRADDFYRESHRAIFSAIIALNEKNEAIDPLTVSAELRSAASSRRRAASPTCTSSPRRAHRRQRRHYGQLVKEQAMLRRLLGLAQRSRPRSRDRRASRQQLMEDAERTPVRRRPRRDHGRLPLDRGGPARATSTRSSSLSRDGQSMTGTPSGFRDIDDITGGFQKSNLIVLAARPSMGKSALVDEHRRERRGQARPRRSRCSRSRCRRPSWPSASSQARPDVGRQAAQGPGRAQRLAAR